MPLGSPCGRVCLAWVAIGVLLAPLSCAASGSAGGADGGGSGGGGDGSHDGATPGVDGSLGHPHPGSDGGGVHDACASCIGLTVTGGLRTAPASASDASIFITSGGFELGPVLCAPNGVCVTGGIVP
jgi:hypothetical protein